MGFSSWSASVIKPQPVWISYEMQGYEYDEPDHDLVVI